MRKNVLLLVFMSFALMVCAAVIISAFIDAGLGTNDPAIRDIGVFPVVSLVFLVFVILLLHLILKNAKKSPALCGALKYGVLFGFLFFIPQSILLYEKTSVFFESEIVHFSIYNILEAFLTNIVLRILYGSRKESFHKESTERISPAYTIICSPSSRSTTSSPSEVRDRAVTAHT